MSGEACGAWHLLIQADLDGELNAAEAASVAQHVQDCAACAALAAALAETSARVRADATRFAAPPRLRARLAAPAPPPRRFWTGLGAGLALAASVALLALPPRGADVAAEMVAAHVRALQPGHLLDVVSTDRHTVKPWFAGRIDYAPPVRDFAAAGFPLTGARLDYVNKRAVAVLVYAHGKHLIDVAVWPHPAETALHLGTLDGFTTAHWAAGGMMFWAVSDVGEAEMRELAALLRA